MDHAVSDSETPSWRKPAGVLGILAYIAVWAGLVVGLSDAVAGWWWPLQAMFYLVTGIVWIAPLRPVLLWMETGRWR